MQSLKMRGSKIARENASVVPSDHCTLTWLCLVGRYPVPTCIMQFLRAAHTVLDYLLHQRNRIDGKMGSGAGEYWWRTEKKMRREQMCGHWWERWCPTCVWRDPSTQTTWFRWAKVCIASGERAAALQFGGMSTDLCERIVVSFWFTKAFNATKIIWIFRI